MAYDTQPAAGTIEEPQGVQAIAIKDIHVAENHRRGRPSDWGLDTLARSIEQEGQAVPDCEGEKPPQQKPKRRKKAAKKIGKKKAKSSADGGHPGGGANSGGGGKKA